MDTNGTQVKDEYYILAKSGRVDLKTLTLKHDETFGVFAQVGDILKLGMEEQGIYHQGTRHLSRWELLVEEKRPLFLSSGIKKINNILSADLTNPDIPMDSTLIPRDTIHFHRSKFLWKGNCYESIFFINFGLDPVTLRLTLLFEADFEDIFEVRGIRRAKRGEVLPPEIGRREISLVYLGLDGVKRMTRLLFSVPPVSLEPGRATFSFTLTPKHREALRITMQFDRNEEMYWKHALTMAEERYRTMRERTCQVSTSNEQFNAWFNTSLSDIHMMLTDTEYGMYPYAGVPWFNAAFGRDGIITALECLWFEPRIARGVLSYLAATQADKEIPESDAEPGKIVHEVRLGEMAALGEVPFGKYYGSVDATPLFIYLCGAYYRRTGDLEFVRSIWPNVKRALDWIDRYGDLDGDGFVEYGRRSEKGLINQGWKDSSDSVFHMDGRLAEGPIALCEVQGYVYAAKVEAALLAFLMGEEALARKVKQEADTLKEKFERAFWVEDLGIYALALDGRKQPCRVRTSNAGHCIFTGIATEEHVYRMAETLLSDDFFSGWGIRTAASTEARYNPMSYHNGSIWPHDNALIAMGFARYGLIDALVKVFSGIFDGSKYLDQRRLPELFCGFHRRAEDGPTLYPVACMPQAWASGTVFLLLQACIGLSLDQPNRVILRHPALPEFLQEVFLTGLKSKDGEVDLVLRRHRYNVSVDLVRKTGDVEVLVIK
ncbi:MAG: amylo-alpha-1,6-glucosidase [Nitrospirales bacterium]|nr:amylo-alpha-1,6-glucosidase [Nitrospirales bacterium]